MATAAQLFGKFQTVYGDTIGSFGGKVQDLPRIPTGVFAIDLAIGGGLPKGRVTIIAGPESCGKSTLCLMAIANHQRLYPDEVCVYFDLEHTLDPKWATKFGVDMDKVLVVEPLYAEQAVDMITGLLETDDIGLIVLDSTAVMVTEKQVEAEAEKATMATGATAMSKLVQKSTVLMEEAHKKGRTPSMIYVCQSRTKIGIVYGDPETYSGGATQRFQATLVMRLWGKSILDPKISKTMPILKETKMTLKKVKMAYTAVAAEYKMVLFPHNGLEVGETDDWGLIEQYLRSFGVFEKTGKGWMILGEEYPTQKAFIEKFRNDKEFSDDVRSGLIKKLLEDPSLVIAPK